MTNLAATGVVVLIPAKDSADSITETVRAARSINEVERVLVIDDGSSDATSERAVKAGADVLKLPRNLGKAGAVMAGIKAAPHASVYLMIDADVGQSGGAAEALLGPVLENTADMTVGVLPSAGSKGGFGMVRNLSAAGIKRGCGFVAKAPLSGQRAIRGELLRSIELAPRFGLETALTIDAVRSGARVVELDVNMDHRHTGRKFAGFRHRGRQGLDILRALWVRLTSQRLRMAIIAITSVVFMVWMLWSGGRWEPSSNALSTKPSKVIIFGVPRLSFEDLQQGNTPNIDGLLNRGAVAAMSVRTMSGRPSTTEGYASLNAGTRVRADAIAGASAYQADELVEGGTAIEVAQRRTGRSTDGQVVVIGYPTTVRQSTGKHLSSEPGALGDALNVAGVTSAVIGNGDLGTGEIDKKVNRPIGISLVDRRASVDTGRVDAGLLKPDPQAPFGVRFDKDEVIDSFKVALQTADVIAIDPGDIDRATAYAAMSLDKAASADRTQAIERTDELLGDVLSLAPKDSLIFVMSVSPASQGWHLTPFITTGPGIEHGYAQSPSVKRLGVVTVTDIAPSILEAVSAEVPTGMIGHALRYRPDKPDMGYIQNLDRDAGFREGIYLKITITFVVIQALLYLFAITTLSRLQKADGLRRLLRMAVVTVAGFPLATFLFRAVPEVARLGDGALAVLIMINVAITALALRANRHALSPLAWITGITTALIVIDLATGARLQYSSLLGYSLHTAARFFGIGNTAFATLGACAAIAACLHVEHAPRRKEALLSAAALLAIVVISDGAPKLGNDVGGILTLVPVYGLTLISLSGRRLNVRHLLMVGALLFAFLGIATGLDLLRDPESRTHLGRFAADLFGGNDTAGTTIARKLATNLRVLGTTFWAWMVPITTIFIVYVLAYLNEGSELLPRGSAKRVGVLSTIAVGLLGFAVNDSGVVVTALVFVFLGPYFTLLALQDRSEPTLLVKN